MKPQPTIEEALNYLQSKKKEIQKWACLMANGMAFITLSEKIRIQTFWNDLLQTQINKPIIDIYNLTRADLEAIILIYLREYELEDPLFILDLIYEEDKLARLH